MSLQPFESHCGCCVSRRRFLAVGCGACAAAALPAALSWSDEVPAAGPSGRPRVRLVFACWAVVQDRPTWPHIGYDFAPDIERVATTLKNLCLEVEVLPVVLHAPEAAEKLLADDQSKSIDGYVVYQMNNWVRVMEPIVTSGKPVLVADFLFAGSGGFLNYTARSAPRVPQLLGRRILENRRLGRGGQVFCPVEEGGHHDRVRGRLRPSASQPHARAHGDDLQRRSAAGG